MSALLEVRGLTVELPTAEGWVRPVIEVSLRINAGEPRWPHGIAVMRAGQFVEVGPAQEVLHQAKNPYTRELLAAVPELPRA